MRWLGVHFRGLPTGPTPTPALGSSLLRKEVMVSVGPLGKAAKVCTHASCQRSQDR